MNFSPPKGFDFRTFFPFFFLWCRPPFPRFFLRPSPIGSPRFPSLRSPRTFVDSPPSSRHKPPLLACPFGRFVFTFCNPRLFWLLNPSLDENLTPSALPTRHRYSSPFFPIFQSSSLQAGSHIFPFSIPFFFRFGFSPFFLGGIFPFSEKVFSFFIFFYKVFFFSFPFRGSRLPDCNFFSPLKVFLADFFLAACPPPPWTGARFFFWPQLFRGDMTLLHPADFPPPWKKSPSCQSFFFLFLLRLFPLFVILTFESRSDKLFFFFPDTPLQDFFCDPFPALFLFYGILWFLFRKNFLWWFLCSPTLFVRLFTRHSSSPPELFLFLFQSSSTRFFSFCLYRWRWRFFFLFIPRRPPFVLNECFFV